MLALRDRLGTDGNAQHATSHDSARHETQCSTDRDSQPLYIPTWEDGGEGHGSQDRAVKTASIFNYKDIFVCTSVVLDVPLSQVCGHRI